jgi:hypothetical protein
MLKAGAIAALVGLLLAIGTSTIISPLCVPCLALLLGLAAGLLAGVFDKPPVGGPTTKAGAIAGAVGGVGTLLGQIIGSVINSIVVGPEGARKMIEMMGFPTQTAGDYATTYWGGMIGSTLCFSFLDILLMAGLGALGALLWQKLFNKSPQPPAAPLQGNTGASF